MSASSTSAVSPAESTGHADYNVALCILPPCTITLFRMIEHVLAHRPLLLRGAGSLRDVVEVPPQVDGICPLVVGLHRGFGATIHTETGYFLRCVLAVTNYTDVEINALRICTMKRLDDGKVSLVEFMRSIRFSQRDQRDERKNTGRSSQCQTHFADFDPQARPGKKNPNAEERTLVRSAN